MKRKAILAAALTAACLAGWPIGFAGAGEAPASRTVVIVDPGDVRKLYADKTWFWSKGAAFFAATGQFRAWSGSGGNVAYAVGRWRVSEDGRMCFDASWYTKQGATVDTTCFAHRRSGDVWYQKRDPSGAWYVFLSDPPRPDDEFAKLVNGDLIEAKVEAARAQVAAAAP
jgi:hypothetical protein